MKIYNMITKKVDIVGLADLTMNHLLIFRSLDEYKDFVKNFDNLTKFQNSVKRASIAVFQKTGPEYECYMLRNHGTINASWEARMYEVLEARPFVELVEAYLDKIEKEFI